jgi:6-phosphofructokinase 1
LNTKNKRIAINVGSGFTPGINAVAIGATLTAGGMGWEVVGIRDGFDGLLYPDRYPDGGLVPLSPQFVESLDLTGSDLLGQSPRVDPFHVRRIDDDGMAEEIDVSDELLERLKAEGIDALISVVGGRGLSILYKLHRKGLNTVCIPRSVENDIASTMVSFGFNSALTFTIEMLDRARQAARASRQIGVIEVLGSQSGWLALQGGVAAGADVILIPEIPCDLRVVAAKLEEAVTPERPYALVVVAEGAKFIDDPEAKSAEPSSLRASLSPLATDEASDYAIRRSGRAADAVARKLQLLTAQETYPAVLGPWARAGSPSAVDRQLALAYGAAAVRALNAGENGAMVAFQPPDIDTVPLVKAINRVRTVPADSEFVQIARSLGIFLGEAS